MLGTATYFQLISAFGIFLLSFLACLSFFNYESLHLNTETHKSSAFMLLLAAVFYLLVFVFSSYYINKQRVVVSSKRDVVRKVYQIEHDLNDNDVHAPLIES